MSSPQPDVAPAIPLANQIACAAREVRMRARVYPRWVATGKMSQEEATREIAAMQAIVQTLTAARDAQPPAQPSLI